MLAESSDVTTSWALLPPFAGSSIRISAKQIKSTLDPGHEGKKLAVLADTCHCDYTATTEEVCAKTSSRTLRITNRSIMHRLVSVGNLWRMKALGCGEPITALWSTVRLTHTHCPAQHTSLSPSLSFLFFLSFFPCLSLLHLLSLSFSFPAYTFLCLPLIIYYFYHWISGLCKLRHNIFSHQGEGRIKREGGAEL